jgi:hydroxymethylpyrimidine pyrophosphatase-like HAD family hydrolase
MRLHAFATDYDGTLAEDGVAAPEALEALRRLRRSGRRPLLVTGRTMDELRAVFDELELFDAIVAENGAVTYDPVHRSTRRLAQPPPPEFVEALRAQGIQPLTVGEVIVATWQPHEAAVLRTIRELGLDLTVIFNKGAVMVLPPNVNKASGLAAQMADFGLSLHNVAGIGDAENDLAFLALCEASAATANALDSVKAACDLVTEHDHGAGVAEFADRIIANELADVPALARRHAIALGTTPDGDTVNIPASSGGVLLAGTSGGGKTTLVTGIIERLQAQAYTFCIFDPEGDYSALDGVITVGDAKSPPNVDTLAEIVASGANPVVSLLAVAQPDRPAFAHGALSRLAELQAATGRPHWCIVDEAHHIFPVEADGLEPVGFGGSPFLITTRPELVAARAVSGVDLVIAVGDDPSGTIASARAMLDVPTPPAEVPFDHAHTGTAVVWSRAEPGGVRVVSTIPARHELRRHVRKYAEGELAPEKSFYFTGPHGKQRLRAQNLMTFAQLADGVDDEAWQYHRRRNDYSNWMRDAIGDGDLGAVVRSIENDRALGSRAARDRVIEAVRERYTTPA